MSQRAIIDFAKKLNNDQKLQEEWKERFGDLEAEVPADDLLAFAQEKGFEFSREEAREELSDAELEGVAGGTSFTSSTTYSYQLNYDYTADTFTLMEWSGGDDFQILPNTK